MVARYSRSGVQTDSEKDIIYRHIDTHMFTHEIPLVDKVKWTLTLCVSKDKIFVFSRSV